MTDKFQSLYNAIVNQLEANGTEYSFDHCFDHKEFTVHSRLHVVIELGRFTNDSKDTDELYEFYTKYSITTRLPYSDIEQKLYSSTSFNPTPEETAHEITAFLNRVQQEELQEAALEEILRSQVYEVITFCLQHDINPEVFVSYLAGRIKRDTGLTLC